MKRLVIAYIMGILSVILALSGTIVSEFFDNIDLVLLLYLSSNLSLCFVVISLCNELLESDK